MTDSEASLVILQRLDQHEHKLDEVLSQVRKTNGRVTALEMAKAVDDALAKSSRDRFGLWRSSFLAVACVVIGWALSQIPF